MSSRSTPLSEQVFLALILDEITIREEFEAIIASGYPTLTRHRTAVAIADPENFFGPQPSTQRPTAYPAGLPIQVGAQLGRERSPPSGGYRSESAPH